VYFVYDFGGFLEFEIPKELISPLFLSLPLIASVHNILDKSILRLQVEGIVMEDPL